MSIWFHGTQSRRAFRAIMREGLKAGTYFTPYLDTALSYGGRFIFAVWLKDSPTDYWEWVSDRAISRSEILFVQRYWSRLIHHSPEMEAAKRRDQLHEDHPDAEPCSNCRGYGEYGFGYKCLSNYIKIFGGSFKHRRKISVCERCKGYGYIPRTT